MSTTDLKKLNNSEKLAFELIQNGKTKEVIDLIKANKIRINCLDENGMNLLDQACFKGNETLADFLLENKINVNNRAHEQGYTCLMFAALSGKPTLCQKLLDFGVQSYAVNSIGKTASEMAAFVGYYECVSVISSYIAVEEIDKLLHPKTTNNEKIYPNELTLFIHKLTRTHEVHPIRLFFNVMNEEILLKHRKKILYVVDRLFEQQLRNKQPNEVMSVKLWLILFTLRGLLKFVEMKLNESFHLNAESESNDKCHEVSKAIENFAHYLLRVENINDFHGVRPMEENFLRTAIYAFPYKQLMLHSTLVKTLNGIKCGYSPSAFIVICQALFGFRFVEKSHFCLTCGIASSTKRCKSCKSPYCSINCQRFDWAIHKKICDFYRRERVEMKKEERHNEFIEEKKNCKNLNSST